LSTLRDSTTRSTLDTGTYLQHAAADDDDDDTDYSRVELMLLSADVITQLICIFIITTVKSVQALQYTLNVVFWWILRKKVGHMNNFEKYMGHGWFDTTSTSLRKT